jgi:hypothetical protein
VPTKNLTISKDARIAVSGSFEAGAGASSFLPVGEYGGYSYRALLQATMDWAGVYQITSAKLKIRVSTQSYVAFSSDPDVKVQRLTSSWSEGSSDSLSTGNAVTWANQPSATATGETALNDISTTEGTWETIDITDIVDAWAPASVLKSTGAAGGGATNYGIRLLEEGTGVTEFYSSDSGSDPYIELTYTSNSPPGAPTNVRIEGKVSGSRQNAADNLYLLTFTGNDPGDVLAAYDYTIDDTTGNGVTPDWAIAPYLVVAATGGISGQNVSTVLTLSLTRGQWYALRVRTKDDSGAYGTWSSTYWFQVNQLPVATKVRPTASQFAYIHNLEELAVWAAAGSHPKAQLSWSFSDPNGSSQTAWRARIYSASTGGTTLYDSGKVVGTATSVDTTFAGVAGTEYWWTIEVWDDVDESSGESSRTAFKMRFGQAIYEHNAGAGSSSWQFSNAGIINGEGSFAFASASGAAGVGRSAWQASVGDLTVQAYVNILVRMQPNATPGTSPQLPDMSFSYLGAASSPDRWSITGTGASMVLDPSVRRYGSQSLKVTAGSVGTGLSPYRTTTGDDIPVQPNTTYTISVWVRTITALPNALWLRIQQAGGGTVLFSNSAFPSGTQDTRSFPDGWQRLWMTFKTSATTSLIRPQLWYSGVTAINYWVDAWKLEEGTVASPWTPGFVGDPVVLDANGIVVDANAGGIFRARGSVGGARDQFELGPHGLLFTDVELWSPTNETLRIGDGLAAQVFEIDGPASGTAGGELSLLGAGANADHSLQANGESLEHSASSGNSYLRKVGNVGSRNAFLASLTGDATARLAAYGDATMSGLELGDGTAGRDTNLYRNAPNVLKTDDDFLASRLGVGAGSGKILQRGSVSINMGGAAFAASSTLAFSPAFDNVPIILLSRVTTGSGAPKIHAILNGTPTVSGGVSILAATGDGTTSSSTVVVEWVAIDVAKFI